MATAVAQGLQEIVLDGFQEGMFRRGSRETIPRNGAYDLTNVLLQDDGKPYRRAGSAFKSNAALDANPLYALWDGAFSNAGGRTVFVSSGNRLGVLASDDVTPVSVYPSGALSPAPTGPITAVKVGNHLVFPGTSVLVYAGSRKTADYTTGSVAVTSGSRVVTGSGTTWTTAGDTGMYINITGAAEPFQVQSVDSNTQITLDRPWVATGGSGKAYGLSRAWSAAPSNTLVPVSSSMKLCSVSNRLAYTAGHQVGLSDLGAPWAFTTNNWLSFGGTVVALANVRDTLLVFTTAGMYAVSGLAASTPADPAGNANWRLELANTELIAWSHEGIASWAGRALVPCLDGIWTVDTISGPQRISDKIRDLYLSYIRTAGYRTGVAAVHNGHYFLPILNGTTWVDTLVCRLESSSWTHLAGNGAKMNCFAARRSSPTALLGADNTSGSRVFSLGYFQPTAALKSDHDGVSHQASITTGDLQAGEQPSMWKRARVWQEGTVDSGSPTLSVSYQRPQDGSPVALNGSAAGAGASASTVTALSDASSYSWWGETIKRGNRIRLTLTTTGPLSTWVLHKLSVFFRPSGRQ
jgi:hypothetical protein